MWDKSIFSLITLHLSFKSRKVKQKSYINSLERFASRQFMKNIICEMHKSLLSPCFSFHRLLVKGLSPGTFEVSAVCTVGGGAAGATGAGAGAGAE